ncbi:MAG TPA: lmo0937 family membrane protein [Labilithrix sp.]|nr:lmo0937 family membrane protein [Labilithrix sp.]
MMNLLWAVAALFILMWALGFAFHVTAGGLIHVLLVLAIVSVVARVIMGRKVMA